MKQLILSFMLLLASIAMGAEKANAPRPSLVVTTPLTKGIVNPLQTYVGTLYYDVRGDLASEEEGVVEGLAVREGEQVKKGDLIVELDSKVLKNDISAQRSSFEALQAELTRLERNLERSKELLKRKAISETNYDNDYYGTQQLRAQAEASKHQLEGLETRLAKRSIRAPYDGVITSRDVEVGEWVGKGAAVVSMAATDTLEAHVSLPASLINTLKGQKAFSATVGEKAFEVSLKSIVPAADTVTRTFPVEFAVPADMNLIEGMRIDIQVPTLQSTESLMIPRDAVIKRFGQNVVFANVEGKAVMIPVQVIGYSDNKAAINGQGLAEGMLIVIKGNERIFPNMPLMEKPKGK